MAYGRRNEDTHVFEAKINHTTAKAHLIEMTLGGEYWCPKSQIRSMEPSDGDGNYLFEVSDWWWGVKKTVQEMDAENGQT